MADNRIVGGRHNIAAIVDVDGQLKTLSRTISNVEFKAWQGDAFTILAETTLAGAISESFLFIKNTRTDRPNGKVQALAIDGWTLSSDSNVKFEIFLDSTLTSGGTQKAPLMLHRGKSAPGESSVIIRDSSTSPIVATSDPAKEMRSIFIGANVPFHESFQGSLLLPPEGTILIKATGAALNKVRVMLNAYWTSETE